MSEVFNGEFDPQKYKHDLAEYKKFLVKKEVEEDKARKIEKIKIIGGELSKEKKSKVSIHKKLIVEFILGQGKMYHFYDSTKGWIEVTRDFFMDEMEEAGGYRLVEETDTQTIYCLDIEN